MAERAQQLDLGHSETRQRLLIAAGEVFAEKGFRAASIRDISQRAAANIAAINYHFGDKERLYREVLRFAHGCNTIRLEDLQFPPGVSPEDKLLHFVRGFIHSMLGSGRPAWSGRLMAREMIDPTPALDEVVEQQIRVKFAALRQIVAELLTVPVEHAAVRWIAASVVAQCLFWEHSRPVIVRLYPDLHFSADELEQMARHVTRFSLGGIRGAAASIHDWPTVTAPLSATAMAGTANPPVTTTAAAPADAIHAAQSGHHIEDGHHIEAPTGGTP